MWSRGCRPEFTRGLHEGVGFSAGITRVLFKNEFPALIGLVRGFSIWFDRVFCLRVSIQLSESLRRVLSKRTKPPDERCLRLGVTRVL